jgi:hypothetical protein
MSYNLQRSTHFDFQQSELSAIHRDFQHGRYGTRNTFDEWETRKTRAEDAPEEESGEDELERARR